MVSVKVCEYCCMYQGFEWFSREYLKSLIMLSMARMFWLCNLSLSYLIVLLAFHLYTEKTIIPNYLLWSRSDYCQQLCIIASQTQLLHWWDCVIYTLVWAVLCLSITLSSWSYICHQLLFISLNSSVFGLPRETGFICGLWHFVRAYMAHNMSLRKLALYFTFTTFKLLSMKYQFSGFFCTSNQFPLLVLQLCSQSCLGHYWCPA